MALPWHLSWSVLARALRAAREQLASCLEGGGARSSVFLHILKLRLSGLLELKGQADRGQPGSGQRCKRPCSWSLQARLKAWALGVTSYPVGIRVQTLRRFEPPDR